MTSARQVGRTRLDRSSTTSLWQQLRVDLRSRLAAGEFADVWPGGLILVQQ